MNTQAIITASERMLTLTRRAAVSDDADARRDQIKADFLRLATELGLIAQWFRPPTWTAWPVAIECLHTEAAQADERRSGTFAHAPSEMALMTTLRAAGMVLGFTLADAATALDEPEDEAARRYAEGAERIAAE